jgi:hypothetical protein
MKQFYVDTQGNKLIQDAITTAAEIAGIRVSEFLREEEYRQIILRFLDGKPDLTANHRIEPGWGEQYTIDQALQYFRELKEERKKPKFEVGDYIINWHEKVARITEIIPPKRLYNGKHERQYVDDMGITSCESSIRLANEAEQKIIINGHEMTFDPLNNVVSFGCAKFSKWQFIDLYKFNKGYPFSNRKLVSVKLDSGIEISYADIEKIRERLK